MLVTPRAPCTERISGQRRTGAGGVEGRAQRGRECEPVGGGRDLLRAAVEERCLAGRGQVSEVPQVDLPCNGLPAYTEAGIRRMGRAGNTPTGGSEAAQRRRRATNEIRRRNTRPARGS